MNVVNDDDQGNEDGTEGNNAPVNVGVRKKQALHAKSKGHKQGDLEQHTEKYVFLRGFDVTVHSSGQGP